MTYAWHAFVQVPSTGAVDPRVDAFGNLVFGAGAAVLLLLAWGDANGRPRA